MEIPFISYRIGLSNNSLEYGSVMGMIISAFFGGFFAGLFTNIFESRRRIRDKRTDRYYDHRNSLVLIEHEMSPLRINLSRNINTLIDAQKAITPRNIRIILRLFKLNLTPKLSLQLLNVDLINEYLEVYEKAQLINSDIEYLDSIVQMIKQSAVTGAVPPGSIDTYMLIISQLREECEECDDISLKLLVKCQAIFDYEKNNKMKIRNRYVKKGELIEYVLSKKLLVLKKKSILNQEAGINTSSPSPKFMALYMDLKADR